MTFRSLFRITVLSGSLWACVNQYTSPGGEVENNEEEKSKESSSPSSDEPSDTTNESRASSESSGSSSESKGTPEDAKREPTETSGSCDDRSCVSASDCCKGYQCAFDPERSKVIRYCLPQ